MGGNFLLPRHTQLHSLGKSCNLSCGLGAGAKAGLLPAAKKKGQCVFCLSAGVQCSDTLGTADLVGGKGDVVRSQIFDRERYLKESLNSVGVEQGALAPQTSGDLRYREHRSRLVVHQHDADHRGILPNRIQHVLRRNPPLLVWLHISCGVSLSLQLPDAVEHSAVLHCCGDNVPSHSAVLMQSGPNGPVVPLGAAGGKQHLLRLRIQSLGDNGAAAIHQRLGLPAKLILRGRVSEVFRHDIHHNPDSFRIYWGGGGVI